MYKIGIDLGGTNTVAGLVDENGHILDRASVKTNLPTTMERIVASIIQLTHRLLDDHGLSCRDLASLGVGVPCTANKETGCMEDADHLGFPGGQLVAPLHQALQIPIFIENDANAAAWGEYRAGHYGADSFFLVTLGTGIGGGIICNGKLLPGINHAAGELGHMSIDLKGNPCVCGRRGCFETYGSATALICQTKKAMEADKSTLLWQVCGGNAANVEAKTVFTAAAQGDRLAAQLIDDYTTYLAEGLTNIVNILAPAYLCIGGGVSHAGDRLLIPVRDKIYQRMYAKAEAKKPQIVLAKLHNDAGILGAALLEN